MGSTLSENIKITKIADYTADGTTTVTSSAVDMLGYDGVVFITSYATAAADNFLKAQQSSDDAGSDAYTDLEGTAVGVGASDEDVWLEIHKPQERYLKCLAVRTTSSVLDCTWAIQYGARTKAVDNTTAGTIHGESHVSPAEGTA